MNVKDYLKILDLCLFEKNGVQNLYISAYDEKNKIIIGNIL